MTYQIRESEAYAEGCNARNEGRPITANPYPPASHGEPYKFASPEYFDWQSGWADVDRDLAEAEAATKTEGNRE